MKFISKLISVLAFSGAAVATQAAERTKCDHRIYR